MYRTVCEVRSDFMVRHGDAGAAIVHLLPSALPYDGLSACTPSPMVGTGALLPAQGSQGLVCTSALWIVNIDENWLILWLILGVSPKASN